MGGKLNMVNKVRGTIFAAAAITMMLVVFVIGAETENTYAAAFKPKVTVKANKITVTWAKQKGFKKYEVWYKLYYKGGFKKLKTVKKLKYTFSGKYCTSYRLYIKAKKGKKSKKSSEVKFDTGSNPKLKIQRIATLPSKKVNATYNASRVDAMCFVGDDLYYLKSAHNTMNNRKEVHKGYYPMAIGCIKNFAKHPSTQNPKTTFKVIKYSNGSLYYGSHGSSITYYNGDFYIVPVESHKKNGKPIIRVGKNGRIKQEISTEGFYYNNYKFSTLAFFGTTYEMDNDGNRKVYPQFICRDGKNTTRASAEYGYELHRFSVGTLKDGVLTRDYSFMTENTAEAGFWQKDKTGKQQLHSNDIGYDRETGTLWHSIFIYEKDGTNIKDNWLYSYDVSSSTELWPYDTTQKTYELKQLKKQKIALNKTKSSETKLEIEGVDVYNGQTYIAVNTDGIEDGLYLVK